MCFLLISDQKKYSFLLKQRRYGDNMGRDDYPVTTTLALDLLIHTEGGIWIKQQSSKYLNQGGVREDVSTSSARDTHLLKRNGGQKTTPLWSWARTGQLWILHDTTVASQVTSRTISLRQVVKLHATFRSSTFLHRTKSIRMSWLTTIGYS